MGNNDGGNTEFNQFFGEESDDPPCAQRETILDEQALAKAYDTCVAEFTAEKLAGLLAPATKLYNYNATVKKLKSLISRNETCTSLKVPRTKLEIRVKIESIRTEYTARMNAATDKYEKELMEISLSAHEANLNQCFEEYTSSKAALVTELRQRLSVINEQYNPDMVTSHVEDLMVKASAKFDAKIAALENEAKQAAVKQDTPKEPAPPYTIQQSGQPKRHRDDVSQESGHTSSDITRAFLPQLMGNVLTGQQTPNFMVNAFPPLPTALNNNMVTGPLLTADGYNNSYQAANRGGRSYSAAAFRGRGGRNNRGRGRNDRRQAAEFEGGYNPTHQMPNTVIHHQQPQQHLAAMQAAQAAQNAYLACLMQQQQPQQQPPQRR